MDSQVESAFWYSFISGDKNAFSAFFKMHYTMLYSYGLKISQKPCLTEDCLQDFFIYLYENRKSFANVKSPKAYIITSFRRALLTKLKKELQFLDYDILVESIPSFEFSPEDIAIKQEFSSIRANTLSQLLNELSPREREAIYLKYYSELKITEISSVMNISYQSVLNTIQKAFLKLRKEVENEVILNVLKD